MAASLTEAENLLRQKQAVTKETKINKNKYAARESNTIPASNVDDDGKVVGAGDEMMSR